MTILRAVFRTYPAISRTLAILVAINLVTWACIRIAFCDNRPRLYMLGDSCIRSYHMAPGTRMEDLLQGMLPGMLVENWAESGTSPLDFLLQLNKGALLCAPPTYVVVVMAPDKMLGLGSPLRVHNADLRWLPLDRTGLQIWKTLSPQERNNAVVEKASLLLYGFTDLVRSAVVNYWKWPHDRAVMRHNSPCRRREIKTQAQLFGKALDGTAIGSDADFDTLVRTRDTRLLLDILCQKIIPHLVVLHPCGNPTLLSQTFSPRALAKRDTIILRMRKWLNTRQTAYIDFNLPNRLSNFPDSVWDDNAHLKATPPIYYLSQQTVDWLSTLQSHASRGTHAIFPLSGK